MKRRHTTIVLAADGSMRRLEHDVLRTELIKETLAWLDRYLGPVR